MRLFHPLYALSHFFFSLLAVVFEANTCKNDSQGFCQATQMHAVMYYVLTVM